MVFILTTKISSVQFEGGTSEIVKIKNNNYIPDYKGI